jgi:acyl-CoA synthetase (AMP-forming)/AMP-acid ligase II
MNDPWIPWPGYRSAPERLNLAVEVLDASIARGFQGPRVALAGSHGTTTYGALLELVNAVAAGLRPRFMPRRSVADQDGSSVEFAAAFLAAVRPARFRCW